MTWPATDPPGRSAGGISSTVVRVPPGRCSAVASSVGGRVSGAGVRDTSWVSGETVWVPGMLSGEVGSQSPMASGFKARPTVSWAASSASTRARSSGSLLALRGPGRRHAPPGRRGPMLPGTGLSIVQDRPPSVRLGERVTPSKIPSGRKVSLASRSHSSRASRSEALSVLGSSGRLWVGRGSERRPSPRRKRTTSPMTSRILTREITGKHEDGFAN